MEQATFRALVWAATILGSIFLVVHYVNEDADNDNRAILAAVQQGIDPIKARCAIKGITSNSSMCVLAALGIKSEGSVKPSLDKAAK